MRYINLLIFFFAGFLLLTIACVPYNKLRYLQNNSDTIKSYQTQFKLSTTIKPGDQLFIKVFSFDKETYDFFNSMTQTSGSSLQNVDLISYLVTDSGTINFPLIGKIKLSDLTLEQAELHIKLYLNGVVDQPSVIVKFVNKNFSIMGEVSRPGNYVFTKNRLNIFEAIAMAGDISYFGNRRKVVIIREENNFSRYIYVDLTDRNIVENENYYIKTNDVIYVEPLKNKVYGVTNLAGGLSLVLSTISLVFVLISAFK